MKCVLIRFNNTPQKKRSSLLSYTQNKQFKGNVVRANQNMMVVGPPLFNRMLYDIYGDRALKKNIGAELIDIDSDTSKVARLIPEAKVGTQEFNQILREINY